MKMTDYEIGYMAGIIDGEGCIALGRTKPKDQKIWAYRPHVIINMTKIKCLTYIKSITGLGNIGTESISSNPNWASTYSWNIRTDEILPLLNQLEDHLVIKTRQASLLIDYMVEMHYAERTFENEYDREYIYYELEKLNRRGISDSTPFAKHRFQPELNITNVDIGYLAGLIDGEGSIGLNILSNYHYSPRVRITNTKIKLLNWCLAKTNIGKIIPQGKSLKSNHAMKYDWTLTTKEIVGFLEQIKPHLQLKQRQAELVIEYVKNHCKGSGYREVSEEEMSIRRDIFLEMQELNQKGAQIV